jgi:ABC-type uncharacterized transport system YnjBCD permease subunit
VFFVLFRCPVSCVPHVASFSGLSILDCHFGFLSWLLTKSACYITKNTNWLFRTSWRHTLSNGLIKLLTKCTVLYIM